MAWLEEEITWVQLAYLSTNVHFFVRGLMAKPPIPSHQLNGLRVRRGCPLALMNHPCKAMDMYAFAPNHEKHCPAMIFEINSYVLDGRRTAHKMTALAAYKFSEQ